MQELLQYEDFEQYDAAIRAVQYRAAVVFGIVLWAASRSLLGGALLGLAVAGGVYLEHRRQLARLRRVLSYDPRVVSTPPATATHRLPCALVISGETLVPGSLYLIPDGLLFRSNVYRRPFPLAFVRAPRTSPLELLFAPAREVTLDARLLQRTWLQRLVGRVETPLLIVQIRDNVAAFRVASTFDSLRRLESTIDIVRHGTVAD